ncbi:hypothetical protein CT676_42625 [Bradyrhizobium sp. MOS001]|uniref:hypothetical protein n=1 Tax=Bradyrhizobium sp. MOS001 TaxID=2133948 RepID=UPI0010751311|nr:hypothetical protein [Bradyrhizobium sp. MOS001]TFW52290.1 hypothetical protein CT676_42625 [Bradyrhizobium sp. MOS001]
MIEQLNLEDLAWQLAAKVYRLNLHGQLTGRTVFKRLEVSEEELAAAIRDSFTQANDAAYRAMVKLATEAALETYDRVVSDTVRQSRSRHPN